MAIINDNKYLNFDGLSLFWNKVKAYIDSHSATVIDPSKQRNISYNDLKALRDSKLLTRGMRYRIIDYVTIIDQNSCMSDGTPFDIIVTAIDDHTLSEEAEAAPMEYNIRLYKTDMSAYPDQVDTKDWYQYEGDVAIDGRMLYKFRKHDEQLDTSEDPDNGYYILTDTLDFSGVSLSNPYTPVGMYLLDGSPYDRPEEKIVGWTKNPAINGSYTLKQYHNLNAWKIWYCLDNDKNRFEFASVKGKSIGIIYNGSPYYAEYVETKVINGITYDLWYNSLLSQQINGEEYHYIGTKTSAIGEYYDIIYYDGNISTVDHEDVDLIRTIKETEEGKGVIYRMIDDYGNDCPYDFYNVKSKCYMYSPYASTYHYTFTTNITSTSNNALYTSTTSIIPRNNVIKPYITYGFSPYNGDKRVQFINSIIIEGNSSNNMFSNNCYYICIGDGSQGNVFGSGCAYIFLGKYCMYNTFKQGCQYISTTSAYRNGTIYNYYKNNIFQNGCMYILFTGTETASYSAQVQNYNFIQGLQGTSSAYLTVSGKRNRAYDTTISRTSAGTLYGYCLAEIAEMSGVVETF